MQPIPSPDPMLPFEELLYIPGTDDYSLQLVMTSIINRSISIHPASNVNVDGLHANAYAKFVEVCDLIRNCCFQYLTNYSITTKQFKYRQHMPSHY